MGSNDVTFIGGGNMGRSLVAGLIASGHRPQEIRVSEPRAQAREAFDALGVQTTSANSTAVEGAAVVVLAVKPQVLAAVLRELGSIESHQLVISIAAGVPLAELGRMTARGQPIVRCMPNTPALLGAGITALCANAAVGESERARAQTILGAVGKTLWVEREAELDAVTAVSGSGPAYFFYLMEAMVRAGTALGLAEETARVLTVETAYGAARMARENDLAPAALRAQVTSPGGTTERALAILDAADFGAIIDRALAGAAARSQELAEEFGRS